MKQFYFVVVLMLSFLLSSNAFAGGTTYPVCPAPTSIPTGCAQALPFCTGTTYSFPNTTGTGNQGALECLSTTPNPTWYYLEISVAGNIDIFISQVNGSGTGIDVDFALLGPYTSVAAACANPSSGCVEDCSYSSSATETANIVGAQVGEIYLLLLTNFANQPGTITFSQTGGSGATDCSILEPSCIISSLTANPSTCSNNIYDVSGAVTFNNPPTTGTLTVSNSCGGSQVFNAPFTSPINYNITGLSPTGGSCTVTAIFSADSDCSANQAYTAPSIPIVNAGSDVNVCQETQVTLSGSGANSYSWSGGITNGVAFTPSIGSVVYTVTGTNTAGCTSTDEVQVTATSSPIVSAGTYPAVCEDVPTVALSGSPSGGVFSGTGVSGTSFNTASGTQVITYSYTDGNNCSGSATATIVVNPLPLANAGSDLSICQGSSAIIAGSGAGTGTWSPSTGLSATNVFNPTASPVSTTTYTLTVNDGQCTNSDQVTVYVSSPAELTITANQSICVGECVDISVSGATYYLWSTSSDIVNPTDPSQIVCPSATTTYDVTGYVAGGNAVSNGNFSGGAVDFTSDYLLNSNTQNEGTYFVTTNANFTHPGFTGVDHTTGTGNFLVVNGSSTPNSSVWCQTISVQPNTDYVFSTWVSTLAIGSPAILQFSINGSTLGTPFTAPSVTNVWDEFYATWNSGSNTTATICIVNQNTSLGGNDFGLDDIFFAALCSSTASVTVTVNQNPTTSAGNYSPVCINAPDVNLVGSPSGGSFSGTGVSGNVFDPSVGSQQITYSYTDGNGCSGTSTANLVVNQLPNVSAGLDQSVCQGTMVTLNGAGASTYSWSGSVVNGVPFTANSTATYSVSGTDINGCVNSDQVIITALDLPQIVAGNDQSVCAGEAVTLNGSGAGTLNWSEGIENGVSFVPANTMTYTLSGTDANGCVGTDQMTVVVNALPSINGGADVTVCEGTAVTLNGSGGVSYLWTNGGVDGQPFMQGVGSTIYSVTGTDANGCVGTDDVTVTVVPIPTALVNADVQSGLPPLEVNFSNTSINATSYTWFFGNAQNTTSSTTNGQSMVYHGTGTYIVQLIADNGYCTSTDTVHIVVLPFPDPIIHIPNVFTPNGDGSNDYWTIDTEYAVSLSITIFNRWGNKVAEITELDEVWDGTSNGNFASDGVYFFLYKVVGINDMELTGHGNVTLIR